MCAHCNNTAAQHGSNTRISTEISHNGAQTNLIHFELLPGKENQIPMTIMADGLQLFVVHNNIVSNCFMKMC